MYVEKVQQKKKMSDGLFICQRVSTSIFLMQTLQSKRIGK